MLATSTHQSNSASSNTRFTPPDSLVKEEDEELAALGGKTRLVPRKSPSLPASPQDHTRVQGTPSPHSSPVQAYPTEHSSPVHHSPVHERNGHGNHGMLAGWQAHHPLDQDTYPNYYTQSSNHNTWPTHDPHYQPVQQPAQSSTMMMPSQSVPYSPYDQLSPVNPPYMPTHSPTVDTHMSDPQASWQSFYAQYQPGMAS